MRTWARKVSSTNGIKMHSVKTQLLKLLIEVSTSWDIWNLCVLWERLKHCVMVINKMHAHYRKQCLPKNWLWKYIKKILHIWKNNANGDLQRNRKKPQHHRQQLKESLRIWQSWKLGKMKMGELGSKFLNDLIGRFEKNCHDSLHLMCSKP